MVLIVKLQDIVDEMDTLSDELHAYLNKQTGELVTISSEELQAAEEEDAIESYPEWQREAIQKAQEILDSDDYLSLPSKFDIHEYSIIERFCTEIEDAELSDELLFQIQGSGAFQRFKHAIYRYDIVDDWYRYRQKALEKIAIDWLEVNSISCTTNEE
ncbi:MAG TPA: hypothetical protein IGS53_20260 [Leptolyngbyaceae cyanobacterium M33_DOE_097]|uniref:Uncharacterized protein n=1 Tax=Oscillatoriales cyanobacterium SpSt-418 TaxID=2282169 RepID=A0A7C3PLU1_9CYAN|nr:hypothetical protein [Leptolyngbyaceae cyanobacterium M33_DOE_097]